MMKATLHVELTADEAEEAQRMVEDVCRKLRAEGKVGVYRYEIVTTEGPVTERCVLAGGKVIA